jgi:hypothetical protein
MFVSNSQFENWTRFLISWCESVKLPLLLHIHHDLLVSVITAAGVDI